MTMLLLFLKFCPLTHHLPAILPYQIFAVPVTPCKTLRKTVEEPPLHYNMVTTNVTFFFNVSLSFQNYSYFTMLILLSVYLRISHHHSCRMCSICLALRINFSLISSNNFLCHCPGYRFLGKL